MAKLGIRLSEEGLVQGIKLMSRSTWLRVGVVCDINNVALLPIS